MKNVIVLGSTGTLGVASLKVLKKYEKYFRVFGLVAGKNGELLAEQASRLCSFASPGRDSARHSTSKAGILSASIPPLKTQRRLPAPRTLLASRDGQKKILELIRSPEVDIVINLIPGLAGLPASASALKSGKTLLLANKESLVAEGEMLMKMAKHAAQHSANNLAHGASAESREECSVSPQIIPLDSEHNAIFEILKSCPRGQLSDIQKVAITRENLRIFAAANIESIYLPCSGGPFLGYTKSQLKNVTVKDVLNHPVWKMGPKVTVESATLLNKGFEILEAHYLFGLPLRRIKVFIHPEGQVHGIVKFRSAAGTAEKKAVRAQATKKTSPVTALAYLSRPSMAIHIENALRHAANLPPIKGRVRPLSAAEFKSLTAPKPNHRTFPGIKIVLSAFAKAHSGKNSAQMMAFLKREEKAIAQFLSGKIKFTEILTQISSQ